MSTDNTINQKAIGLLNQAASVSSGKDVYPVSKDETLTMKALLEQAYQAADDPKEDEFKEKYGQLSEVVDWSLKKHRTWNWVLIAGVAIFAALLFYLGISNRDSIKSQKQIVKEIKAWEPCDTVITWETCKEYTSDAERLAALKHCHDNANNWKADRLAEWKSRYLEDMASSASYKEKAEKETDPEKKKGYLHQSDYWGKYAVPYKEDFDKLAPMEFKDVKDEALKGEKKRLSAIKSDRNLFLTLFLLLAVMIGLYIWSGNLYGYDITKARTRIKILGWIRKAGLWVAGTALGTGVAAKLFADDQTVKYTYSDGRTETRNEADVAGTAGNVVWKIILIVVGALTFVGISCLVMFLETAFNVPVKIRHFESGNK